MRLNIFQVLIGRLEDLEYCSILFMLCAVIVVINHPLLETRETFVGGTPQHGQRHPLVNDT